MANATSEVRSANPAESSSTLSSEDRDTLFSLFENWERFADANAVLAPISPLAVSLLSLDHDSSNPGRDLTKIIDSDPILAARVLGLANSVAFAGSAKPIFRVGEAITRLGTDTVLTAAFAQLTAQWLRGACRHSDRSLIHSLWLEYLVTAHCARAIAMRLSDEEVEVSLAYAAGLLHDVGTIALLCVHPDPMARFVRSGYDRGGPLAAGFVKAHTQLGAALLRRWRTPGEIATVASRHHSRSVMAESAASITVFLADHLHMAVLDHDRADFEKPDAVRPGCFGNATETISAALAALGIADELDSLVGRVAAESRSIEMLGTVIHL